METERLTLRELTMADWEPLFVILSDAETMKHYPQPFDRERVKGWIEWNLRNYADYGFGLWAVVLKAENRLIGDCGITMQKINGSPAPEVGYHIDRRYARQGYGTEAARACVRYAFETLGLEKVYSYMKYTNLPSQRVAQKCGMSLLMEYPDEVNTWTRVYALSKDEYAAQAR